MLSKETIVVVLISLVILIWYIITTGMSAGVLYFFLVIQTLIIYLMLDAVWKKDKLLGVELEEDHINKIMSAPRAALYGLVFGIAAAVLFAAPFFSVGLPSFVLFSAMPFDQRMFAIIVLAPLIEDLLFRGAIHNLFFLSTRKNFAIAVILVAFFFGIYHLYAYTEVAVQTQSFRLGNVETIVGASTLAAMVFSVVLSLANNYTKNIITGIVMHAIVNFALISKTFFVVSGMTGGT